MATLYASGTATGSGSTSTTYTRRIIFSGRSVGRGAVHDELLLLASGTATGIGSTQTQVQHKHSLVPLPTGGAGSFRDTMPLPSYGLGTLTSVLESNHYPCGCTCRCQPGRFHVGHQFQMGDLELYLEDSVHVEASPNSVLYTMYQVVAGYTRQLIYTGIPVRQDVGHYYATGFAGRGGQPGTWVIVWTWPGGKYEEKFCVLDVVREQAPEHPGRFCKSGWL